MNGQLLKGSTSESKSPSQKQPPPLTLRRLIEFLTLFLIFDKITNWQFRFNTVQAEYGLLLINNLP